MLLRLSYWQENMLCQRQERFMNPSRDPELKTHLSLSPGYQPRNCVLMRYPLRLSEL